MPLQGCTHAWDLRASLIVARSSALFLFSVGGLESSRCRASGSSMRVRLPSSDSSSSMSTRNALCTRCSEPKAATVDGFINHHAWRLTLRGLPRGPRCASVTSCLYIFSMLDGMMDPLHILPCSSSSSSALASNGPGRAGHVKVVWRPRGVYCDPNCVYSSNL